MKTKELNQQEMKVINGGESVMPAPSNYSMEASTNDQNAGYMSPGQDGSMGEATQTGDPMVGPDGNYQVHYIK